jgi:PAT family beta-lactamase induction signal transducer AmpG
MPDLLSTRRGRLTAFCLLYITEGIPQGFAAIAVATQMRRQGLSPAAIGTFVATLYLPWSWKWAIGPVVDLVYSDRLGRRRGWIVGAQLMMALTLLAAMPVDYATRLTLFTWVIVVHNVFAATQDVAIDALAVATLPEDERGVANGLMFAGAYTGSAIGGSGALFLASWIGMNNVFPFVAGAILLVTVLVTLRLREPKPAHPLAAGVSAPLEPGDVRAPGAQLDYFRAEPVEPDAPPRNRLAGYLRTVAGAMFGTRAAVIGLLFALLPNGAYALSLALQSNLQVELGFNDQLIAWMTLASTLSAALGCVAGGWISDRIGRRAALAAFVVAMSVPTICIALFLQLHGRIMPLEHPPAAPPGTLTIFWTMTIAYSLFQGLMYGARSAFFMDFCNPKVGATQFTAYMALLNLVIAYSAWWQGWAAGRVGYPMTLFIDATFGCVGLLLLPWCKRPTALLERDQSPSSTPTSSSTSSAAPR